MINNPANPLIVQSDRSLMLEVNNPLYKAARDALAPFAELIKSPEHMHMYSISPLSLWNAASVGYSAKDIIETLEKYSKYDIPANIKVETEEYHNRYGKLKLNKIEGSDNLELSTDDALLMAELLSQKKVPELIHEKLDNYRVTIKPINRGEIKQVLIYIGYPIEDLAGYLEGTDYPMKLKDKLPNGNEFQIRNYQLDAAETFFASGSNRGGSGIISLPCGSGKTIVAMTAMCLVKKQTLILTTNITAVKQWKREILEKTDIKEEDIGEYNGETKTIKPITIATYQILTYRKKKTDEYPHFTLFNKMAWGFLVYDEVHLLPAPVFRLTASIQSTRRLGLTATLVREDGKEKDVFSLIGPKKYDAPWKDLEQQGWIAEAQCVEVRVELPIDQKMEYAVAPVRKKIRIASENVGKLDAIKMLLEHHKDDLILIIGQYLEQINLIANHFDIPIITGQTPNIERERLFQEFRDGVHKQLVVSKVGNFAVDLPDANIAIQVSGSFGSRQEEAQRLGRILRPKNNGAMATFYSLITRDSREQDFAMNRQLFLTEQGYTYDIIDEKALRNRILEANECA